MCPGHLTDAVMNSPWSLMKIWTHRIVNPRALSPMVCANCRGVVTASSSSGKISCGAIGDLKYVGVVNLALGEGFTQVRPLSMEVKTYFLLRLY